MADFFTRQERAAWGGFIVTQARVFARIEEHLRKRYGITHAEFEVLLRLTFSPGGRARLQELADQSLLTRSGTSRVVERLGRAGHVEREGAEEDGRGAYAVLTRSGRAHFMSAAREHVALVRKEFLSRFTEKELEQLASFWARLAEPAEPAKPKPRRAKKR